MHAKRAAGLASAARRAGVRTREARAANGGRMDGATTGRQGHVVPSIGDARTCRPPRPPFHLADYSLMRSPRPYPQDRSTRAILMLARRDQTGSRGLGGADGSLGPAGAVLFFFPLLGRARVCAQ